MAGKNQRRASRAAGTAGNTGQGGSAKPAASAPSNYYRPAPTGNSMPPGGMQNPANVAAPPAAANVVEIPIATVALGDGTANQQLGGGAKVAGVKADQGQYSNNPPGTSNTGDASVADPPPAPSPDGQ